MHAMCYAHQGAVHKGVDVGAVFDGSLSSKLNCSVQCADSMLVHLRLPSYFDSCADQAGDQDPAESVRWTEHHPAPGRRS